MLNRKAAILILTVGLIKKILLYENELFFILKLNRKQKSKLDLSNYATKSDLKNATGVDTSQFAKRDDLPNLKLECDKLVIDKLAELDADKLKLFLLV